MRFKDKKGNEIECTVEEYRQLMDEDSPKEPEYPKVKMSAPKEYIPRKANPKTRTRKEMKEIAEKVNKLIKKSDKTNLQEIILPTGMKYQGANYYRLNKVYKRMFKELPKDTLKNRGSPKAEKKPDKKKEAVPCKIPEKLPEFRTLNHKGNSMIETVVKNVIANRGRMTFLMEGRMIGLERGLEWKAFTEEFWTLKGKVAEYFGVEDHFKMGKIDNKYDMIEYKKE